MSVASSSRFPQLALPFAALGAAVGWAATGLLENPLVGLVMLASHPLAAGAGAIAAAGVGLLVTWWGRRTERREDAWVRPIRLRARAAALVVAAGAAVGALVGWRTGLHSGTWSGALCGICTGLAAMPLVASVFAAGVRAQRARHGSIVAAADRRAVWAMCSGALVVPALATALDWPMFAVGRGEAPWVGLAMAIVAVVVLGVVVARDRAALGSLATLADGTRPPVRDPRDDARKVDLGLGDDLAARYASTGSAYRGGEREEMVLVGSVEDAARAIRFARFRGIAAMGLALATLGVHLAARSTAAAYRFDAAICVHEPAWCGHASRSFEARGGDRAVALGLLATACRSYDSASCDELGRRIASLDANGDATQPCCVSALAATCAGGVGASCRWLSEHAATASSKPPSYADDLACRGGELSACGRGPTSVDPL